MISLSVGLGVAGRHGKEKTSVVLAFIDRTRRAVQE
jgi:hypothetical protein